MAASGWQSGAEPKKKQTQAKMMIILEINVKLLASSVGIIQCSILNILVIWNHPHNEYEEKDQTSKSFRFENHSYVYLLVHYVVRRSAIFRSKRENQTCKPDGHQT